MIKFCFVGDIMLSRGVGQKLQEDKEHTFLSKGVNRVLKSAYLVIGNLETPVAREAKRNRELAFRAYPETLDKISTISLLSLANNHLFDCGEAGIKETIEFLDEKQKLHCGIEKGSAKEIKPLRLSIKGKDFSFFSGCCSVCQKGKLDGYGIVDASTGNFRSCIQKEKENGRFVIVLVHGGDEMIPYPPPTFIDECRGLIDSGASVVVTHHPHVLGGMEKHKDGFIFYSMGDFVFDAKSNLRRKSAILELLIDENEIQWKLIPVFIRDDYITDLANEKLAAQIIKKYAKVSKAIRQTNYLKRYRHRYLISFVRFQADRFRYISGHEGLKEALKFVFSKLNLLSHYSRKLTEKKSG